MNTRWRQSGPRSSRLYRASYLDRWTPALTLLRVMLLCCFPLSRICSFLLDAWMAFMDRLTRID